MEPLALSGQGGPSFHWANWDVTCGHEKRLVQAGGRTEGEIKTYLDACRGVPLWIKNGHNFSQGDLFSLYQAMTDVRVRGLLFSRRDETLISTVNESGPYMSLKSMRWFDKSVYRAFVYHKILSQYFPTRSFRLNVELPIPCAFGRDWSETSIFTITQLCKDGILFQIKGPSSWNHFKNKGCVFWNMDWGMVLQALGGEGVGMLAGDALEKARAQGKGHKAQGNILCLDTRVAEEYTNPDNCQRAQGHVYDVFARYDDFSAEGKDVLAPKDIFAPFVKEMEALFMEVMDEIELELGKAALQQSKKAA